MKNLDPKFLEILQKIYSKEDVKIVLEGFSIPKRNTTFRVNTLKSNNEEIEQILKENSIEFEKVKFLENAYILLSTLPPGLGGRAGDRGTQIEGVKTQKEIFMSLFNSGKIYLQSISSQIPVSLLDIKAGNKILDITASPGGKTSQAAAKLQNTGEIVAVDNNAIRIDKLNFTLNRQGVKNTKVIKYDATNLSSSKELELESFDVIIADLPCSSEGKFNLNNEKSFAYWNEEIVKKNYKVQKEILKSVIPLLKDNGELIYSTCTINPYENEDIVHFVLCNFPEMQLEEINLDFPFSRNGILKFENKSFKKEVSKCIRILPSKLSEGFFVAKFRKV